MTPREAEVLELLVEGRTHAEIGATLGLSPHTVGHAVGRLLRQHDARNGRQLVVAILRDQRDQARRDLAECRRGMAVLDRRRGARP